MIKVRYDSFTSSCGAGWALSPITRPTIVWSINTFSLSPFGDGEEPLASDKMKPSACTSNLLLVSIQKGRTCKKVKAGKQDHRVGYKQRALQWKNRAHAIDRVGRRPGTSCFACEHQQNKGVLKPAFKSSRGWAPRDNSAWATRISNMLTSGTQIYPNGIAYSLFLLHHLQQRWKIIHWFKMQTFAGLVTPTTGQ